MKKELGLGSVKRFGARYGRGVRHKLARIEALRRKKHTCPYCNALRVKRITRGIWECRKCHAKFTGKAYTPAEQIKVREEVEEKTQVKVENIFEEKEIKAPEPEEK